MGRVNELSRFGLFDNHRFWSLANQQKKTFNSTMEKTAKAEKPETRIREFGLLASGFGSSGLDFI